MTNRLNGCVVVFDNDVRVDDAEEILNAIRMVKGVLSVSTDMNVVKLKDYNARERVRWELREKLWEVLYPKERTP